MTANQFLAAKVRLVLQICEELAVPDELDKRNIPQLNRLLWLQLADRDLRRSLPGNLTRPIKLTMPDEDRQRVENSSRKLRWSSGQVIVEALQAYAELAADGGFLNNLPDITRLYRGNWMLESSGGTESVEVILNKLNLALGRITAPKPPSEPSQLFRVVEGDIELG